ncbi:hypothetical protein PoB_001927700 [Plakobranchus ocellatus]|uniref:Uncharacterized protein n=1 Tax=Plakobranchus ocellatus TaxID=259542 RepID=A0AAV3ZE73_9GAST|nr:hypothetical protein PoB_001927700 [Plakobranchus ocellatus]
MRSGIPVGGSCELEMAEAVVNPERSTRNIQRLKSQKLYELAGTDRKQSLSNVWRGHISWLQIDSWRFLSPGEAGVDGADDC